MEHKIIDILIEGLFEYRRGLIKQVESLEKTIEKYQGMKEQLKSPPKSSTIIEADKQD